MNNLDYALHYAEHLGFSVIPLKPSSKIPLISEWKKYQSERASSEQITKWWTDHPSANIGIVCGEISGLVVVDVDDKDALKNSGVHLPPSPSVTTGKGFHVYYHMPQDRKVHSAKLTFGDLKSEGGYVVAPPSVHPTGALYSWDTTVPQVAKELTEFPEEIGETTVAREHNPYDLGIIPEGSRNDALASFAGKLMRSNEEDHWKPVVLPAMYAFNLARCKPPLAQNEVLGIFSSIASAEYSRRQKEGQNGKKLPELDHITQFLLEKLSVMPFRDQKGEAFVRVRADGHYEVMPCGSNRFKNWISKMYYEHFHKTIRSESLKSVLDVISGKAVHGSEEHSLSMRFALRDNELWYDMSDDTWSAVKITVRGWEYVTEPPIIFKRLDHQVSQKTPVRGGNVEDVLQFVNITDKKQKMLFLVYLVAAFVPGFPHPIAYFYGPQGSAKSTVSRIIRALADPSQIETAHLPRADEELMQLLDHHSILALDNISYIQEHLSDILCKIVTGTAFSKRRKYTDNDDVIMQLRRIIILNGINLLALKPDLLERTLLFPLERVSDEHRRQESDMWSLFEKKKPLILGAIFDALARALDIKPKIHLDKNPRMADFAVWGCAIAEALGYSQEAFMETYWENIESQDREVAFEDPVANALITFMKHQPSWEGTAAELLAALNDNASEMERRTLPKNGSALGRKLNILTVSLGKIGLSISKQAATDHRVITITKTGPENEDARTMSPENIWDAA